MIEELFHYNKSTLAKHLFADIALLQAFQDLRSKVHRQMEKNLQTRLDRGKGHPTDFELMLDAFKEEIEPQVWNAVRVVKPFHLALQESMRNANKLTGLFL